MFLEPSPPRSRAKTGTATGDRALGDDTGLTREQRVQVLKEIIGDLHAGGDIEQARARFARAVEDVEASEIAAMEEELIAAVSPCRRCRGSATSTSARSSTRSTSMPRSRLPAGHPIHTYMEANQVITRLANQLGGVARAIGAGEKWKRASSGPSMSCMRWPVLENHYQRKENQLFPVLERHDVTGPSQVMWGVHDQIRAALKAAREAVDEERR